MILLGIITILIFKIIIIDQDKSIDEDKLKGFDNIIYSKGFGFLRNIIKY
jgi:hypothetical protein